MGNATKETLRVAGIEIDVFRSSSGSDASKPIVALFLLHGRLESRADYAKHAEYLVSLDKETNSRDLVVITLDHRNHGSRLLDLKNNKAWSEDVKENNADHAIDMFATQYGTALDVTLLIDFLPAYLYPFGDREIVEWGVAGISLGGHSTWIALGQDKRLTFGSPIIGCPDYMKLMSQRATKSGLKIEPPYFPKNLMDAVKKNDPAHKSYKDEGETNPFYGKRILVLSGELDELVPWTASEDFVTGLKVGPKGEKSVYLQPGVGHKCTETMMEKLGELVSTLCH